MTRNRIIAVVILLAAAFGLQAQWKYIPKNFVMPQHPRILLFAGEEKQIKNNIASDPLWAKLHQAIMDEADTILTLPEQPRTMTGKRLGTAYEFARRIFYCSYAFRMSRDDKYLRKAEKEMLNAATYSDWNPSHFLDVAEATLCMSIGYDWLYDRLSPASRETIVKAILYKGISPTFNSNDAWFLTSKINWNQVCNAGITYGAYAIYDEMPDFAKMLIERSINSIKLPMGEYAPDGAYPEGYSYWSYGTSLNIFYLSALEKIFKTDFGLSEIPGFLKTASYQQQMLGPNNLCFNFSDCGLGGSLSPAMFWFASKLKDPSLLWNEKSHLERGAFSNDRVFPAVMIWGKDISFSDITAPKANTWVGHGGTPVALMRTSWTNPKAIYLAFKGGTASSSHSHIDVGSFVMDANGERWASDFGSQDYNSLETKGVDLWNMGQNSQRWEVFRYNNFVHNTLTINNELHRVKGFADIQSASSSADFMNAVSDLSMIFEGQLAKSVRGVAIINGQYVAVRDEIKTLDTETTVRWTMLTTADAKITGSNAIELRKNGKKLKLEVAEPAKVTMKTWPTTPTHDYDSPNPGSVLVGFEVVIPATSEANLIVKLIPQGAKTSTIPPLSQWPSDKK